MPKYRKKPVVVEAFKLGCEEYPSWFYKKVLEHEIIAHIEGYVEIITLEGRMTASVGDYIIKGVQGELYPCKPDIFKQTYDEVIDDNKKQKETYLSKYLKENNCSYEEFVKDQEMYDGFCPVTLESPCPRMGCMECWNREIKEE